jgi:CBS domain-containing protein
MVLEKLPATGWAAIGILVVVNILIYKFVLKGSERKVKEFMTSPVVTLESSASVGEASKLMSEKGISCVVIEEGGKPKGLITEKDINKLFSEKACNPDTPVKDVMSPSVECVGSNANIDSVVMTMIRKNLKALPVLKDGKIVGIVTQTDIVRAMPDIFPKMKRIMGWDYIEPRTEQEMRAWLDAHADWPWEKFEKEFPDWVFQLEKRGIVRDPGDEPKILDNLKRMYEEKKGSAS